MNIEKDDAVTPLRLNAGLGMSMKTKVIVFLLRWLGYQPGLTIRRGKREYIVDMNGAHRRLGRDA